MNSVRIKTKRLVDIISILGNRFKNQKWIEEISLQEKNFIPYIGAFPWDVPTLSHGIPGLICLYAELDHFFPNEEWDLIAHHYIVELVKDLETNGLRNASLFSGLTGICFAIQIASKSGIRYQTLLSRLVPVLLERIELEYLLPIEKESGKGPLSPFQYDLIVGISGMIGFLLRVRNIPSVESVLQRLVQVLVSLGKSIIYQGVELPGWYVPKEFLFREETLIAYPNGCFDNGMAHGVPGCLAAISKAFQEGVIVPDQEKTIQQMSSWILDKQIKNGKWKNGWHSRIAYDFTHLKEESQEPHFHRDGWCYGDPGVACALFQASKALRDHVLRESAIHSLISVCERSFSDRNLVCVSICHGQGGFLSILHQFYLETGIQLFQETSQTIFNSILETFDEELPFGFKSFASIPSSDHQILIDNIGLLDGTIGALLSLLFFTSNEKRLWTDLFLLS